MAKSNIEWTEMTWNPVTGCNKVSAGCQNCYAERMAMRLQKMGQKNYRNGFKVTLQEHMLQKPFEWKKPQLVFVNSMSDLFHVEVPESYVQDVFNVMRTCDRHVFQVLTKRSNRLVEMSSHLPWTSNIWMGVSVEDSRYKFRIDDLQNTSAHHKFISMEPLLGPIGEIDLSGIEWVIVGGESGPSARPIKSEWVRDIRDQCQHQGVSFFFKQWGGTRKVKTGRIFEGKIWNDNPAARALGLG